MKLPSIVVNNKQNFIFILIFLVFLISSNLIIGQIFSNVIDRIVLERDESIHISVADSFRDDQNFTQDFLGRLIFQIEYFVDMIKFYPTISGEQSGKGPIFYIFLGSFFEILDSKPSELFTHSIIFTQIISSTFIVLFFFLIKREFGLKVAVFSSILVLLTPFFAWSISVRPVPMSLLYVFSIAAFYFLKKKKSHYVLFGIFAGLAHLTHPFGIFVAISYPIYLLINREFKGAIISFGTWIAVLMPWLIRNYYVFGDFGIGLYIPFSNKISSFLTFAPHIDPHFVESPTYLPSNYVDISLIFTSIHQQLSEFYSMDVLIIFILSIFVISSVIYFRKMILHKQKISFPSSRFLSFFSVFGILSVLGYFYTQFWFGEVLYVMKQLMFLIFLSIPIFIFELNNILNSRLKIFHRRQKILVNILLILIILPLSLQLVYGINEFANYPYYFYENSEIIELNKWIVSNIPQNSTTADFPTTKIFKSTLPEAMISPSNIPPVTMTASNIPSTTNIKTNLQSIMLPPSKYPPVTMEYFLHYYDITYIIMYHHDLLTKERGDPDFIKTPEHFFSKYDQLLSVYADEIHKIDNSTVYQIKPITDADISEPLLYIREGLFLYRENHFDSAQNIFDELFNDYSTNIDLQEQLCPIFVNFKNYDQAIRFCNNLIQKDTHNLVALYNLGFTYENTGQQDKTLETLDLYDKLLIENPEKRDVILTSKGELLNKLMKLDQFYVDMTNDMLSQADEFVNQEMFDKAIEIYDELTYVRSIKLQSLEALTNTYILNSQYVYGLQTLQNVIPMYEQIAYVDLSTPKKWREQLEVEKQLIALFYIEANIHKILNNPDSVIDTYEKIFNTLTKNQLKIDSHAKEIEDFSRNIDEYMDELKTNDENFHLVNSLQEMLDSLPKTILTDQP